jgi:hypothetical protein
VPAAERAGPWRRQCFGLTSAAATNLHVLHGVCHEARILRCFFHELKAKACVVGTIELLQVDNHFRGNKRRTSGPACGCVKPRKPDTAGWSWTF